MSKINKRRYSDSDSHFGPFTYSRHTNDNWRPFGIVLDSGGGEERDPRCHLKFHGFGRTLICEMPQLIQPWRMWVDCSKHEWATEPNAGYWDEHRREYGFTVSDGFLQVFLGPQTMDSTTTKSWSKFLPWTQWRFVRKSLYDAEGKHFWTEPTGRQVPGGDAWEEQQRMRDAVPKVVFEFDDYDGKRIKATTSIEEWEWKFGEGWFKWLSLFRRPKIRRSLDLAFSEEVGPEKGSWKGGTIGHSIDMLPGELHEQAFRRYCEQDHRSKYRPFRITYVGKIEA
jgi:hypothetical protein